MLVPPALFQAIQFVEKQLRAGILGQGRDFNTSSELCCALWLLQECMETCPENSLMKWYWDQGGHDVNSPYSLHNEITVSCPSQH